MSAEEARLSGDRWKPAPWLRWCRRTLAGLRDHPVTPMPEPRRLPWYGQVDSPTTHG